MRGLIDDLTTPTPLAGILPSMLREDSFARQLCGGLDEVLAPVLLSLDSFPAYLDVHTTPEDMLPWLAQWLGVTVDPSRDAAGQRELVGLAGELHTLRGTRAGVALAVRAALGIEVTVSETGAAGWSTEAGGTLPGEAMPRVVVDGSRGGGRWDRSGATRRRGRLGPARPRPVPHPGVRRLRAPERAVSTGGSRHADQDSRSRWYQTGRSALPWGSWRDDRRSEPSSGAT